MTHRITLPQFLHEGQRHVTGATGDFSGLVADVAVASKTIAAAVSKGAVLATGDDLARQLRTLAADLFVELVSATSHLSATLSRDDGAIRETGQQGRYLLTFVPLSSSSNLDVNYQTGTIFSILRAPDPERPARAEDFLAPGREMECAGVVQYSGSTRLVLATRLGVDGFTLDHELGEYVLTHPDITIPAACDEVSVHAVGGRSWEPPVTRYVRECIAGADGPRGRDFRLRWSASLVADTSRILTRGGVFLHPHGADTRNGALLSLLTEVNPVAWIVERAGGRAITGRNDILDLQPAGIDQRVPLLFGSRDEVDRLHRYHTDYTEGRDSMGDQQPLFSTRSLFR